MISIIIATYNCAETIHKAVNSVLSQTSDDWELVVIDDGSSDDTKEIINKYNDSRIRYFYQENRGVSAARNVGVARSNGNYIIFLDADDDLVPDAIENFSHVIETKHPGICSGAYIDIYDRINYPRDKGWYFNNHLINNLSGAYVVEKRLFLEAGGYDESLSQSENWELFIRLINLCDKNDIEVIAEDFLTFKYNSDHSTEKNLSRNLNAFDSYKYLYEKYKVHPDLKFKLPFLCAEVVAFNAFKIGRKKDAVKWELRAIKEKPFKMKPYLKLLRFIIS